MFINDRIKHVSSDHMTLSNSNMKEKVVIDTSLKDNLNNIDIINFCNDWKT